MAFGGLSHHLAGDGVEGGKQAQCAVSFVLEAVGLGTPWRQRQLPVLAIQRLDSGLLIDAEHHSVFGRLQVQPDDFGGLGLEVRVVRDHVGVQAVGAHTVLAPNTLHSGERHIAQLGGKLAAAPVRGAVAWFGLQRAIKHPRLQLGHRANRRAPRMVRYQSCQAIGRVRARPAADEAVIATKHTANVHAPLTRGAKQHTTGPARQRSTASLLAHHALQFCNLFVIQLQRCHASRYEGYTVEFNDSIY